MERIIWNSRITLLLFGRYKPIRNYVRIFCCFASLWLLLFNQHYSLTLLSVAAGYITTSFVFSKVAFCDHTSIYRWYAKHHHATIGIGATAYYCLGFSVIKRTWLCFWSVINSNHIEYRFKSGKLWVSYRESLSDRATKSLWLGSAWKIKVQAYVYYIELWRYCFHSIKAGSNWAGLTKEPG